VYARCDSFPAPPEFPMQHRPAALLLCPLPSHPIPSHSISVPAQYSNPILVFLPDRGGLTTASWMISIHATFLYCTAPARPVFPPRLARLGLFRSLTDLGRLCFQVSAAVYSQHSLRQTRRHHQFCIARHFQLKTTDLACQPPQCNKHQQSRPALRVARSRKPAPRCP
jgi:hypothetical protein